MKLQLLAQGKWTVTATICGTGAGAACQAVDFLDSLHAQYHASRDGIFALIEHVSNSAESPDRLGDKLCHEVDKNEKIFEFIKGDLRLLWFYAGVGKIIICHCGLIKKTRKTPKQNVKNAIRAKYDFIHALVGGVELIEVTEDGPQVIQKINR